MIRYNLPAHDCSHTVPIVFGANCFGQPLLFVLWTGHAFVIASADRSAGGGRCRCGGARGFLGLDSRWRFHARNDHAGGVGLCEYVQHLSIFDYIAVSGSLENRVCEYVDHLHEHFVDPCISKNARYVTPLRPGYSIDIKPESIAEYEFPAGRVWRLWENGSK